MHHGLDLVIKAQTTCLALGGHQLKLQCIATAIFSRVIINIITNEYYYSATSYKKSLRAPYNERKLHGSVVQYGTASDVRLNSFFNRCSKQESDIDVMT